MDSAPWKRDDNNRNSPRFSWHQSFGLDFQKLPTSWTHYSRKKAITKEKKRKGKKKGEREPDVLEAITMIRSMFRYVIEEQNHAGKTNTASVGCKTLQPPDKLQTKTDFIISGRTGFEGRKIPLGLSPECYCRDNQLRSLDPWRRP
jgi:hypothetical protein